MIRKMLVGTLLMSIVALVAISTASAQSTMRSAGPKYCPPLPTTYDKQTQVPVWINMEIKNDAGVTVPDVGLSVRRFTGSPGQYAYAGQGVWSGCWAVIFYNPKNVPAKLCISLHLGLTIPGGKGSNCLDVQQGPSGLEVRFQVSSSPRLVPPTS